MSKKKPNSNENLEIPSNTETPSEESPQNETSSLKSKKLYVVVTPIYCNGEMIQPNEEVSAEELGDDLDRLLKIGAILELHERSE